MAQGKKTSRRGKPAPQHLPATSPTAAVVAQQPEERSTQIGKMLKHHRAAFAAFLDSEGFTPERVISLTAQALRRTPKLGLCDDLSLLSCIVEAALVELEPNTPAQECFLIPRKTRANINGNWQDVFEATFQLGYHGARKLSFRATGPVRVGKIWGNHIYAADTYNVLDMPERTLVHQRSLKVDRGPHVASYAVAEYIGEALKPSFELMNVGQLARVECIAHGIKIGGMSDADAVAELAKFHETRIGQQPGRDRDRDLSKPWFTFPEQMKGKTCIKGLCRRQLPMPDKAARAFELDDLLEARSAQLHRMTVASYMDPTQREAVRQEPRPQSVKVQVPASLPEPPPPSALAKPEPTKQDAKKPEPKAEQEQPPPKDEAKAAAATEAECKKLGDELIKRDKGVAKEVGNLIRNPPSWDDALAGLKAIEMRLEGCSDDGE